jgi:hypothetical protein
LTIQEVSDTCRDWEKFCELHGVGYYACNEGFGHTTIELTVQQAHHLGIVKLESWKVEPFENVYPKAAGSENKKER